MKNNTVYIIIFLLMLSGIILFFVKKERGDRVITKGRLLQDGNRIDDTPTLPAPPPNILSGNIPGSSQHINESEDIYDPESGEGLDAINKEIKRMWGSNSIVEEIRISENIMPDILAGTPKISNSNTGVEFFRNFLRGQIIDFADDYDIPITDNIDLIRKMESVKSFSESWDTGNKALREQGIQNMLNLFDFKRIDGMRFAMWAESPTELIKNYLDGSKVYGKIKKDNNFRDNTKKWSNDCAQVAKNIINAVSQIRDVIPNYAINRLRSVGWRFHGYDI